MYSKLYIKTEHNTNFWFLVMNFLPIFAIFTQNFQNQISAKKEQQRFQSQLILTHIWPYFTPILTTFMVCHLKLFSASGGVCIPLLFNFKQLLFYGYPPKNASKYPKIAIMKIDIFRPSYFNVFYMLPRQYFWPKWIMRVFVSTK